MMHPPGSRRNRQNPMTPVSTSQLRSRLQRHPLRTRLSTEQQRTRTRPPLCLPRRTPRGSPHPARSPPTQAPPWPISPRRPKPLSPHSRAGHQQDRGRTQRQLSPTLGTAPRPVTHRDRALPLQAPRALQAEPRRSAEGSLSAEAVRLPSSTPRNHPPTRTSPHHPQTRAGTRGRPATTTRLPRRPGRRRLPPPQDLALRRVPNQRTSPVTTTLPWSTPGFSDAKPLRSTSERPFSRNAGSTNKQGYTESPPHLEGSFPPCMKAQFKI